VRDKRGRLRSWHGAAHVVIEDRRDPARPDTGKTPPLVRGARRYDGIAKLFGARSPEHDAAERFRDDCAAATGARSAELTGARPAFDPSKITISQWQLDGQSRASAAWRAIGATCAGVAAWVVLGNGSLNGYADKRGIAKATARVWLDEALASLVDHYGLATRH
jgi:hypothetical protein